MPRMRSPASSSDAGSPQSFNLKSCKEYVEKEEVICDKRRRLGEWQEAAAELFENLKGMSLAQLSTCLKSEQLKGLDKGKFTLAKNWVMEQEESRRPDFTAKVFQLINFRGIFQDDEDFLHEEFSAGGFLSMDIESLRIYNTLLLTKLKGNSRPQLPPTPPSTSLSDDETVSSDSEVLDAPSSPEMLRRSRSKIPTPSPAAVAVHRHDKHGNSLAVPYVRSPGRGHVKKTRMIPCKKIGNTRTSPRSPSTRRPVLRIPSPRNLRISPTRTSSRSPAKRPRILVTSPPVTERATRSSCGGASAAEAEKSSAERTCLIYSAQHPKGRFLYSYDWQTKRQVQLYKFETPRENSCSVRVGNRMYDLGGTEIKHRPVFGDSSEGSKIVEIFGIGENRDRSRGPSMLENRKELSACVVDDFLYVIGGCCEDEASNACEKLNVRSSDAEWVQLEHHLNVPRGAHTTAVIGKRIFAIGGIGAQHERTVEMFDTERPTKWHYSTMMITPRGRHGTTVMNDLIYAVGGEDVDEDRLQKAEYYDVKRDRWIQMKPMHYARYDLGVCVVNGCVRVVGGTVNPSMPLMEDYDPREGLWRIVQEETEINPEGKFYSAISN